MSNAMTLSTGMTPRAWRMISYLCIGATIYGMVFVTETLQNIRLNRIDQQMKMLSEQTTYQPEEESVPNP